MSNNLFLLVILCSSRTCLLAFPFRFSCTTVARDLLPRFVCILRLFTIVCTAAVFFLLSFGILLKREGDVRRAKIGENVGNLTYFCYLCVAKNLKQSNW